MKPLQGCLENVQLLINAGADVNARVKVDGSDHFCPLHDDTCLHRILCLFIVKLSAAPLRPLAAVDRRPPLQSAREGCLLPRCRHGPVFVGEGCQRQCVEHGSCRGQKAAFNLPSYRPYPRPQARTHPQHPCQTTHRITDSRGMTPLHVAAKLLGLEQCAQANPYPPPFPPRPPTLESPE